ncbi:MAG TPA: NrfD/PsrC family molybdoenzyme membrane anchor subunit [Anaerolineales bacterium]
MRTPSGSLPVILGLAVLVVIGIAAWVIQLTQGMSIIGTGQAIVWGVYIATFFFLAGLAGGLVVLAALADLQVLPGLQLNRRGLLLGAIASFIAAGFMILMDIGKPIRVLNMILSPNLSSPFVWDFASLAVGVVLAALMVVVGSKVKWLSVVAAIIAGLVVVVEGWILSMSAGGPLWHGGMTPAVFLTEGLIAASAITLIAQNDVQVNAWLRRALLVLLPVLALFNLFEIASVLYAGHPEAQDATVLFLNDPLYWGQLALGIVVPFVLLAWMGKNRMAIITAAVLAILGVFVAKYVVLIAGQALAFMQGKAAYTPTLVEIGGVVGIIGLAGLLFVLGQRFATPKAS